MNPTEGAHGSTITTLASREVYRNQWLRLREDQIVRSNGKKGIYGVVDKDDCAIILPIDKGHVWLVEQFRYTIQERALELPQGGWEMEVENPEELARARGGGIKQYNCNDGETCCIPSHSSVRGRLQPESFRPTRPSIG